MALGLWIGRRVSGAADFFVASRRLGPGLIFSTMLAANIGLFDGQPGLGWLHAKIALVVLLSAYHGWAVGYSKKLARGETPLNNKRLRMLNEIPALVVILVVILVIVRPF